MSKMTLAKVKRRYHPAKKAIPPLVRNENARALKRREPCGGWQLAYYERMCHEGKATP